MAQTFSYKPALLGSRYEVSVAADGVSATRGKKVQEVQFKDVTGVRVVEVSARTSSTSLVLLHPGGKFVLQFVGLITQAAFNAEAAGFVRASAAILDALGVQKPETEVSFGGGAGLRGTMFALGVITALVCGGLVLAAFLAPDVDQSERIVPGLLLIAMAIGGVVTARSYNPFRKPPAVKAALAAEVLRAHLGEAAAGTGS